MASDKIHVEVKIKAKGDFASSAVAAIEKVLEKAIKASGTLTTDAPKDKKAPQWLLSGEFSGAPDKDGRKFTGKLATTLLVMNATASGATLSGGGAGDIAKPGKLSAGDVEALAEALAEDMAKKAVAHMKKLKP